MTTHKKIYLKDYQPPTFLVDTLDFTFDITDAVTTVTNISQYRRNPASTHTARRGGHGF